MNADLKPMRTGAELKLAEAFTLAKSRLPGGPQTVAQRLEAFARFEERGLPNRRVEEWKYTDLRALMRDAKPLADPAEASPGVLRRSGQFFSGIEGPCIVLVNGRFAPELSDLSALPAGLSIRPMARALADREPLLETWLGQVVPNDDIAVALNTAFMADGALIHVAPQTRIDLPVRLISIFTAPTAAAVFARGLVVVEAGAQLTLLESFQGPNDIDYQLNSAIEAVVGEAGRLDHVKVGAEGLRGLAHLYPDGQAWPPCGGE